MKLFLSNPTDSFEKKEAARRARTTISAANRELRVLTDAGFLKKRTKGLALNTDFVFVNQLKSILISNEPSQDKDILAKLRKAGKIKLVVTSGFFLYSDDATVDLLIVLDDYSDKVINNLLSQLEAEIGREIRYAVFRTDDFEYRLTLNDHLIRDIFDYPHRILLDKLGL